MKEIKGRRRILTQDHFESKNYSAEIVHSSVGTITHHKTEEKGQLLYHLFCLHLRNFPFCWVSYCSLCFYYFGCVLLPLERSYFEANGVFLRGNQGVVIHDNCVLYSPFNYLFMNLYLSVGTALLGYP